MALLLLVLSAVPLAAMEASGPMGLAIAAPSPESVVISDGAPEAAEPTVEPGPRDTAAESSPLPRRPPAPPAPSVRWRDARALGTPNAGSLANGVRLPAEAPGLYTYDPATQQPPGGADRQWGTARLVREVLDLGGWWRRTHPRRARLGIGDLSREHGGPFLGPVVGHASHQNGLDVDIRLPRRDGAEAAADPSTYDRALAQAVVDRLVARGAELVLVGPNLDLHGPAGVVTTWPAHDDHLHVRFPDPDGTGN